MPTYPVELKQADGTIVKFARAGMVNRSPLVPADKSLIWNLLCEGAEVQEVVEKVWAQRKAEGLSDIESTHIKRAITWARRQMRRDLESQKLNTTEQKRNKRIINSLIDEFEEIGKYTTEKLKENRETIREEWFQRLLDRRLRLADYLSKFTNRAKIRGAFTSEDLKRQKEKNPFIGEEKYASQLPSHMIPKELDHIQAEPKMVVFGGQN